MPSSTKTRELAQRIARSRVRILFLEAVRAVKHGEIELSRLYVEEALRMVKRFRIERPLYLRWWVCRNCHVALVPGVTARVRLEPAGRDTRIVVTCLICGYMRRIQVGRKRGENS